MKNIIFLILFRNLSWSSKILCSYHSWFWLNPSLEILIRSRINFLNILQACVFYGTFGIDTHFQFVVLIKFIITLIQSIVIQRTSWIQIQFLIGWQISLRIYSRISLRIKFKSIIIVILWAQINWLRHIVRHFISLSISFYTLIIYYWRRNIVIEIRWIQFFVWMFILRP